MINYRIYNEFSKAEEYFSKGINLEPDNINNYFGKGNILKFYMLLTAKI